MSVLAKVFVVLLTVFSIAFSMATISFVGRSNNWKKVAEVWRQSAVSANSELKTVTAQMRLTHEQDLVRIAQLNKQINDLQGEMATEKSRGDDLTNQNAQLQNGLASLGATLKGVQQTLTVTSTQLNSEQEFSRKLAGRNAELERKNIDLNDRTKELTVSLAMAHAQNRAYLEQISAMEGRTDLRASALQAPDRSMTVQADVPSAAPSAGPAVSPIRGTLKEVKGNLASISVGSADGVNKGMSFMIYRTAGGGPEYVGTIEITRVEANQAAGQIVRRGAGGEIKVGDLVRDEASFARR